MTTSDSDTRSGRKPDTTGESVSIETAADSRADDGNEDRQRATDSGTGRNLDTTGDSNKPKPSLMNRREFTRIVVGGAAGAGLLGATATARGSGRAGSVSSRINTEHRVGADYHVVKAEGEPLGWWERQYEWTSQKNFDYHSRFGIRHYTNIMQGEWDLDQMKRWRDDCDRAGVEWEMIRMVDDYIHHPPGPEQDRTLERDIENIRKAAEVGVPLISVHWRLIPIRRNRDTEGRGGSTYRGFRLEDDWRDLPVEEHGEVSREEYWERLEYFFTNVIPVCEEYDIRFATHPYDPPGLPPGYQGVGNWNAGNRPLFEQLRRYEELVDSPNHGFQLCLGTVMEGLEDPANELLPIVRYFAERDKIFQIHMRNIRGGLHDFEEVYIDEGEVDFIDVVRILRDTGYRWSYLPDHVPPHPEDPYRYEGFAHAFGYIQSLIDTANNEVEQGMTS